MGIKNLKQNETRNWQYFFFFMTYQCISLSFFAHRMNSFMDFGALDFIIYEKRDFVSVVSMILHA